MHGLKLLSMAAVAFAAIALLSSVAGAANRGAAIPDNAPLDVAPSANVNAGGDRVTPALELPETASDVAVESAASGLATANAAITSATERAAEREEQKASDEPIIPAPIVSAAKARPAVAGGPEEVPGWGCGDSARTHTGPPGKPEASPPPGCDQ